MPVNKSVMPKTLHRQDSFKYNKANGPGEVPFLESVRRLEWNTQNFAKYAESVGKSSFEPRTAEQQLRALAAAELEVVVKFCVFAYVH